MSKKNSQPAPEQKTKVLSTGAFGTIMKSILICAIIGAIIGIGIMIASTFGVALLDSPTAQRRQRAATQTTSEEVQLKEIDLDGVTFDFEPVTYNGKDHKAEIKSTLPEGVTVRYYNNVHTDAGTYTAIAVFTAEGYEAAEMTCKMVINKAQIDTSDIKFENKTCKYNGEEHKFEIEGKLPEGVSVIYVGNSVKNLGDHKAYAILYGDNYEDTVLNATISVEVNDILGITLSGKSFSYDGTVHSLSFAGTLPKGVTATWTNNEHKNVTDGEQLVTLTLSGYGYNTKTLTACITVIQGDLKETCKIDVQDKEFVYDGEAHSLTYSGTLPEGVNANWTNNSLTDAGTTLVSVTFTDTLRRYEDYTVSDVKLTVNPADITNLFVFNDADFIYKEGKSRTIKNDGTAKLPEGITVQYSYDGKISDTAPAFTEAGEYKITLLAKGNDNYKEVSIDAVLRIEKASADYYVSIKRSQSFNSNGRNNLPKYEIYPNAPEEFLICEAEYYLVGDNGETPLNSSLTQPGQYEVHVVIESDNYIFDEYVTVNISYSPVIILYAILVGAVIGLVLGIIISICGGSNDKFSQRHFAVPREGILKVRGSILCESRAKCKNTKNSGRLYLTPQTIEFYAEDYKKSENNFLLNLSDIRSVQVLSSNKIVIHANHKEFTFTVPAGQADEWRYQIVKA